MSWFGWFDDETIYSAGISVTHLIPKLPESPIKAAVISAIRNNGSITNNLVAARSSTMLSKVEAFLAYSKANYYRGLPSASFPSALGHPLPIIAIRENRGNVLSSGNVVAVETTKKALKKLGLSLESITTAINTSPNVNTVDDSYVMLGFNLMSDSPNNVEYFFNFLAVMYAEKIRFSYTNANGLSPVYASYVQNITSGGELGFRFAHRGITKSLNSGAIGPVGAFTRTVGTFTSYNLAEGRREVWEWTGPRIEFYVYLASQQKYTFILRKQITANSFEEYSLFDPTMSNTVQTPTGGFNVIHSVGNTANRATFVLPLFKGVLDLSSPFVQEQFIADGLILYTHSIDSINIPWYQSSGFIQLIGFIVSVAFVYFTGGFGAGLASGLMQVIQAVAISQIIGMVSLVIIDMFTPLIGEVAATVLAVLVTIVAAHASTEGIKSLADLPWAEDLLKSALVIPDIINISNTADALQLSQDVDAFTKASSDFDKELDRAKGLLGTTDSNLKSSNITAIINFYETPDEFYNRTIHQGNIGIIGIDAVSNYTANKLRLPKTLAI